MKSFIKHPKKNSEVEEFFGRDKFTKPDAIKVCWLQQLVKIGGAELSNLTVINGASDDFDIVPVTQTNFNKEVLKDADVIIINNIWRFDIEQLNFLEKVFACGKIIVNYEHDHEAILDRSGNFNYENTYKSRIMNTIFENSSLDVFISPFHLDNYNNFFEIKHPLCLPLAIDTKFFRRVNSKRKDMFISLISSGRIPKDTIHYAREHPDKVFDVYSNFSSVQENLPPNVRLKDAVAYEDLPLYLSSYKNLLFYPSYIHSGGRVLFEAYLCGCKPIFSEKVGHGSWNVEFNKRKKREVVEWLEKAPSVFWEEIKKAYLRDAKKRTVIFPKERIVPDGGSVFDKLSFLDYELNDKSRLFCFSGKRIKGFNCFAKVSNNILDEINTYDIVITVNGLQGVVNDSSLMRVIDNIKKITNHAVLYENTTETKKPLNPARLNFRSFKKYAYLFNRFGINLKLIQQYEGDDGEVHSVMEAKW